MKVISLKRERGYIKPKPTHSIKHIVVRYGNMVEIMYCNEINGTENILNMTTEFAEDTNLINFELLKKILP